MCNKNTTNIIWLLLLNIKLEMEIYKTYRFWNSNIPECILIFSLGRINEILGWSLLFSFLGFSYKGGALLVCTQILCSKLYTQNTLSHMWAKIIIWDFVAVSSNDTQICHLLYSKYTLVFAKITPVQHVRYIMKGQQES